VRFTRFVALRLLSLLYVLVLAAASLLALLVVLEGFSNGLVGGVVGLLFAVLGWLLAVVVTRVALELCAVAFRIHDNTDRILDVWAGPPPTSGGSWTSAEPVPAATGALPLVQEPRPEPADGGPRELLFGDPAPAPPQRPPVQPSPGQQQPPVPPAPRPDDPGSQGGYDPRYEDPRYQLGYDPRYDDPRYDPRYDDPRSADPRYDDPRSADPRYDDPRSADPRVDRPRPGRRPAGPRTGDVLGPPLDLPPRTRSHDAATGRDADIGGTGRNDPDGRDTGPGADDPDDPRRPRWGRQELPPAEPPGPPWH
jgi:hypothetical protein